MRQDVFAMRPRAIGGDEVQPAGHDICLLTAWVATMALLQRCLAVHLWAAGETGRRADATGFAIGSLEGRGKNGWMRF